MRHVPGPNTLAATVMTNNVAPKLNSVLPEMYYMKKKKISREKT
jgi:hypothetical protein